MYRYRRLFRRNSISPFFKATIYMIIIFLTFYFYVDAKLKPYIREYALDQTEDYIYEAMNTAVSLDMEEHPDNYIDIAKIAQNTAGEMTALTTDTYKINKIKTNVRTDIENSINIDELINVNIPLGNIYNNSLFFSKGVNLPIKIVPMTTTKVDFASSFQSAGINQSLHKIIMECRVDVSILMPHEKVDFEILHKIAISETLVLGNVPESYTYIEDSGGENVDNFRYYSN